jgi:DNA-3-methyladenine glycosylase II
MTPHYWPLAIGELSARDAVLKKLTSDYAGFTLGSRGDAFATLARAIVGQQISVKAAQSVWDRLIAGIRVMTPDAVLATTERKLRACGLSGQKTGYIRDLAQHFRTGALSPDSWRNVEDEVLIAELTQVRGIGRWTAEMFLIFYMARPDVLPLDDIGLQRAMSLYYNSGRPISRLKMRRVAKNWAPWRSVATWYLWRSLDPIPVVY